LVLSRFFIFTYISTSLEFLEGLHNFEYYTEVLKTQH